MLPFLTTDTRDAISITPVTQETLPAWIEKHSQSRQWISSVGFKAAPGSFAFLPASDGRAASVLAAPSDEASVFAFADLSTALPEGKYYIEHDGPRSSPTDIALGWALGAYAFDKYKKRERAAATLVWPDQADRAEVERITEAVFLA